MQDDAQGDKRVIRLEITQLRTYDRNPRRCQNGEYERIKASIRAQGLDQPLVVTRRPGEADYMLMSGGNTRLQAMLDLYQETGDTAFRYLDCLYKPWIAESDVLLSHLRENELRDGLHFIDKAQAVLEAKTLLEAEMQGRTLSQRRLSEVLAARGLNFSQTLISRMVYAAQTLWPLIPQALLAGMGTPQVGRIQRLERATRALWCDKSLGSEEAFDDTFAALCRRYDSPDWDTDVLQESLENEIAATANVDLSLIRLALDAQSKGESSSVNLAEPLAEESTQRVFKEAAAASSDTEAIGVGNHDHSALELKPLRVLEAFSCKEKSNPEMGAAKQLGRLRERAYQLANQIAHAHGLSHLVKPLSGQGQGFLVFDLAQEKFAALSDEDWQHLVALTEIYRDLRRISQDSGQSR